MAKIQPLNWFFWTMDGLRPILFWLHRSVPARHAPRFFLYMQEVFNGYALEELQGLDYELKRGTDYLLRVLVNAEHENVSPTPPSRSYYTERHIRGAYAYFSDYFERKRGGSRTFSANEPEWANLSTDQIITSLRDELAEQVDRLSDANEIENAQARLDIRLLDYLIRVRRAKAYPDVPESMMQEFQAMIEPYFRKRFGISIPGMETSQDLGNWDEVRILCSSFWKDDEEA